MIKVKKGSTYRFVFRLVDATDNETPEPGFGGSIALKISKNGGTFSDPSSTTSGEIASGTTAAYRKGFYYYDLDATDTNTAGPLAITVSDTSGTATNYYADVIYIVEDEEIPVGDITDAAANKIADAILRRSATSAYSSSDGDTLTTDDGTLMDVVQRLLGKTSFDAGASELVVYAPNNTTERVTLDLTTGTGSANPVIAQQPET